MSEISRRLLLKLAGAAGVTLAVPSVVQAAVIEAKEAAPRFEYFDGGTWVELGNVIDANATTTIEQIEQGFGRPPMRGSVTTEVTVDYSSGGNDPFAEPSRERFDVRIRMDMLGKPYRFSCAAAMAVSYTVRSNGKMQVLLISRGFPELTYIEALHG